MNRTDRLYALVEELRARAPRMMRAAELAGRFEVSTRTIERDLLALQEAGVPIWAQPGPGGGYSLNVDTTLPPLNLTPAEAAAIATALAATRAMPFAEAGRSALQKLAGVMAAAPRDTAARLVSHIRVVQGPGGPVNPVSDSSSRRCSTRVAIELTYRDGAGHAKPCASSSPPGSSAPATAGISSPGAACARRPAPSAWTASPGPRLTSEPITPRSLDAMLPDFPFEVAEPALM